jgi:hypothetical protein
MVAEMSFKHLPDLRKGVVDMAIDTYCNRFRTAGIGGEESL